MSVEKTTVLHIIDHLEQAKPKITSGIVYFRYAWCCCSGEAKRKLFQMSKPKPSLSSIIILLVRRCAASSSIS
eukprot:m.376620 g.376620  ORF g.376620 m.376620 type:complete len:73 (+) comp28195_c1_seq9:2623-2841(+)